MSVYKKFLELQNGVARTVDLSTNTIEVSAIQIDGATSGNITQSASAVTSSYSIVWPSSQGSASTILTNDGSGVLSWAPISSAPAISNVFTAGESFAANTSFIVRWGMDALSETADGIYKADYSTVSFDEFWGLGIAVSPASVTAGQDIKVYSFGAYTIASLDTPFNTSDIGNPVWLTSAGAFSTTAPTGSSEADLKIGIVMSTIHIWIDGQMMGIGSSTGGGPFPMSVPDGGTGNSSFIPYAVILGGITSTDPLQQVPSLGTSGQVLTSNGPSAVPHWATVSAGSVTSVALTDGSSTPIYGISGSPVTSSGTLTFSLNTQTANKVFAGPASGSAAQPTFRALVSADIPNNAANTTGTASNVTGVVALTNGGTGILAASTNIAFNYLSPMTTAGDMIYENNTPVAAALPIGTAGQVLTVVSGLPTWATATVGANTALSNLALTTSINSNLLPNGSDSIDIGSSSKIWRDIYLYSVQAPQYGTSMVMRFGYLNDTSGNLSVDWGTGRSLVDTSSAIQLHWSTSGVEFNQLTASTVPYLNASKILTSSAVTPTELGYVSGVTSSIQTQINAKLTSPMTTAGDIIYENATPAAARLPIGTSGQVLTVSGGLPVWASPAISPGSISLTQNHILVGNASNLAADVAMSGEASIVASGAITLSNAAVIAKVLTGYVSGAGTISAADSILSAIQKLNGNDALYLPLAGGTMSGVINMGSNKITSLASGTTTGDALQWGQIGAANGIAGLDGGGKVPFSQLPSALMQFLGAWDASTNTPSLADGTGVTGDVYRVSVAGTQNLGSGSQTFFVGDFVIYNGTIWQRSPAADGVISVNGSTGAVTVNAINQLTGDATAGPASGSQSQVLTLATVNSNVGTFASVTVNGKGLVTAASALSGDATTSGAVLTLATVNSNVGSFGSSTSIPSFTVNAKGLITAASGNAVIAPAGTLSGTTLNSTVVSSSLTSVGTITTGVWNGTAIAIANGGTGQTTAASAFNALNPMTTTGDLIYESATNTASRLAIGSTGQVLTVVGGIPSWQPTATALTVTEDIITLGAGDITNQYVDLLHVAQGASALVNSISLNVVGGPEQLKGVDYTVSLTGGAGGVTRVSFAGDLATGGNAALISGDILMIKYSY